jgi:hypothetical protein
MYSNDNQDGNNPNTRKKILRVGYSDDKGNNFIEDKRTENDFNNNNYNLNNNLMNDNRTDYNTRKDSQNDDFERVRANSTVPIPNNLGINYSLKNATDPLINSNVNFGKTDNNFNLDNKDDNNYYSNNSRSNQNNNIMNNNTKDNTNANTNTNTNNNILRNQFQNTGNKDEEQNNRENNNNNKIEVNEEDELVLVDKNNKRIFSQDGKQFKGEQAVEVKREGDQTIIKTKDGRTEKLEELRNEEGELLGDEFGNPLLGKDYIYYIDKKGNPIVLLHKSIIQGDKVVPVLVKKVPYDPFNITTKTVGFNSANDLLNANKIFGSTVSTYGYQTVGIGGAGYSELKRKTGSKNKTKLLQRGDGDAKAPIRKKRRKKTAKK